MKTKRMAFFLNCLILASGYNNIIFAEDIADYLHTVQADNIRGEYLLNGEKSKLEKDRMKYEKLITKKPNNGDAYTSLSYIYSYMDNDDKSLEYGLKAEECGAKKTQLFNQIGMLYTKKGNNEKAAEYYKKTLEYGDNNIIAIYNLGVIYYNTKNYVEAEKFAEKVLDIDTKYYDANTLLGKIYFDKKDYEAARKCFELELKNNSYAPQPYHYLGKIMDIQGDNIDKIIHNYYIALSVSPFNQEVRKDLIDVYSKKGDAYKEIIEGEKKLLEMKEMDSSLYNYGMLLIRSNNKKDMEKGYMAIWEQSKRYPKYPNIWNIKANYYFRSGDFAEADKCYIFEQVLNPNNLDMWYNKALMHYNGSKMYKDRKGFLERAHEYITKCTLIDPLDTDSQEFKKSIEAELKEIPQNISIQKSTNTTSK